MKIKLKPNKNKGLLYMCVYIYTNLISVNLRNNWNVGGY